MAGWLIHPNVGAVLVVDAGKVGGPIQFIKNLDGEMMRIRSQGGWAITNDEMQEFVAKHDYPVQHKTINWMSLTGDFAADIRHGQSVVNEWYPMLAAMKRTPQPLSELSLAQQCGGSDAFSGISANPLLGKASKHIVMHGGTVILAETDELIGGETYVVENSRDFETAQAFVDMVERFKRYAGNFGYSAEGNPSGGNNYRGLYNIVIKSLGAAKKRDPVVRLEHVVDYSEPLNGRTGFCFMDSPGNDMESISGEVACGCNMVCFTTGNGSITNFPFAPTIKILTTTGRYDILSNDIDVNGGRYLDGQVQLEAFGEEVFEQFLRVASGELSVGERCGHHQVQIWRDWPGESCCPQDDETLRGAVIDDAWREREGHGRPDKEQKGRSVRLKATVVDVATELSKYTFDAIEKTNDRGDKEYATGGIGLLFPTSLCSGQAGNMIAKRLHEQFAEQAGATAEPVAAAAHADVPKPFAKIVAIPHTEGCGSSGGDSEQLGVRTLLHHLLHPNVRFAVLLEHGCEKTHNDAFQEAIEAVGRDLTQFEYLSLQLDGGVEKCYQGATAAFAKASARLPAVVRTTVGLDKLSLGLQSRDEVPPEVQTALALVARAVVQAGGTVVCAGSIVAPGPFILDLFEGGDDGSGGPTTVADEETGDVIAPVTLGYGQRAPEPGLHVMQTSSTHFVEMLTGMAGAGVGLILSYTKRPVQSHPMVPSAQFGVETGNTAWTAGGVPDTALAAGVDLMLRPPGDAGAWATQLMDLIVSVASGKRVPIAESVGNVDFQMSRGFTGISL
jgi:altronate dehydratase